MQRTYEISAGVVSGAIVVLHLLSSCNAEEPIANETQAAEKKTQVNYYQLGEVVEVIGALGRPLGKVLIVEGTLFQPKSNEQMPKAYTEKTIFVAERVNGQPLAKPVHISLKDPRSAEQYNLKSTREVKLTGYEDGGFAFESEDVWAYRRKRGEGEAARMQRHFNVDFYVLDAKPLNHR
jgi:hypothetical protein